MPPSVAQARYLLGKRQRKTGGMPMKKISQVSAWQRSQEA